MRANRRLRTTCQALGQPPKRCLTPVIPPAALWGVGLLSTPCYKCRKWGGFAVACAWKWPHIGARLTDGAGETQEQGDAPTEASAGRADPGGEDGQRCLAPASAGEVTQMSPPIRKPWTCEGSPGNSGQEGSGGKGAVETAEGARLLQPLAKRPCSSSALSFRVFTPRAAGEASERCVYLQPFVFFFNFHKRVTWPGWKASVAALAIVSEIGFWGGCVWPARITPLGGTDHRPGLWEENHLGKRPRGSGVCRGPSRTLILLPWPLDGTC